MADKLRAQQQLEALQARFIGIGSADTGKHEWTSNMARDSLSSFIGHPPLLQYMSIGLGKSREQTRVQLLERMVRPVGPPPEVSGREEVKRGAQKLTWSSSKIDQAGTVNDYGKAAKEPLLVRTRHDRKMMTRF
jgi:splicing factor 3B subunit 5